MKNLSARTRIVLLVIVSAFPVLGLTLYNGIAQRNAAEAFERGELRLIAELTAKRPEQLIQGARQLLSVMALNVDELLRDRNACKSYFDRLAPEINGVFRSTGVIFPDGTLFCNSAIADPDVKVNVGKRPYFRAAMDSGRFTVGEFQVGHTSGQSGLNFAYPVLDAKQQVRAVLFAGLNLPAFIEQGESRRESAQMPREGRVVTIYDRNDVVLAQYPGNGARIGEKNSSPEVLARLGQVNHGLFTATDRNGMQRLYAVENVGTNADGSPSIRVVVSTPTDRIFADANRALMRTIIGIVAGGVLIILLAWYGAEAFVVRRFRVLLDMADRVRRGDLTARTGFADSREELERLGHALDGMVAELQARDRQVKELLEHLGEQAITDHLTGLPNRRYLWQALEAELMRARRKLTPVTVMMLDIDHFKQLNDRWGHEAGDLVLKNVTYAIRTVVRGSDIVARHGGEEFVIVLAEANEAVAMARAEGVLAAIAGLQLCYGGQALGTITASIGIAISRVLTETPEELVRIADQAMYEAKQGGRNRVVLKVTTTDPA